MALFLSLQVRDTATGELLASLRGAEVTICEVGTDTPVEITEGSDPNGPVVPGSKLIVGDNFSVPTFRTTDDVLVVDAVAADGTRATLESTEGLRLAAEEARDEAVGARAAAEAALEEIEGITHPTWTSLVETGTVPTTFPPIIGPGPDQAFPGNGNMDSRYYTKSQADARFAPYGSTGGGDATLEGIPSLVRVKTGGSYPPRGTARADLSIEWRGDSPPTSASPTSGADFEGSAIAMQGIDIFRNLEA